MDQNTISLEARNYIADICAHQDHFQKFHNLTLECAATLKELANKRSVAESKLRESPEMRRSLLHLSINNLHTPSLDALVMIYSQYFPNHGVTTRSSPHHIGDWLVEIFSNPGDHTNDPSASSILVFVNETFRKTTSCRFLTKPCFWKSILTHAGYYGKITVPLDVLYNRLRIFDQMTTIESEKKLKEADGSKWLDHDVSSRQQILLEISNDFPEYLNQHIKKKGNNYAYLDDIAFFASSLSSKGYKRRCKQRNEESYKASPPEVGHTALRGSNGSLLGTVLQIENALSPTFVNRYLSSLDQSKFTQDGKYLHHDRGYRFASKFHNHDGVTPQWLLFGEDSGSTLLLSQHTNSTEVDLIFVMNYINSLYTDFVNERFEENVGPQAAKKWCLEEQDHGYFDSLMTMVSNPSNSNYGEHDDGKVGLCKADEQSDEGVTLPNSHSKFQMVVPTVAIQNHKKKTTFIEFYDKKNPGFPVGVVNCGVVTIHIQLIGVQQNCTHKVSHASSLSVVDPVFFI